MIDRLFSSRSRICEGEAHYDRDQPYFATSLALARFPSLCKLSRLFVSKFCVGSDCQFSRNVWRSCVVCNAAFLTSANMPALLALRTISGETIDGIAERRVSISFGQLMARERLQVWSDDILVLVIARAEPATLRIASPSTPVAHAR